MTGVHAPDLLHAKAQILSRATVRFEGGMSSPAALSARQAGAIENVENHHANPWLFFRLSDTSRVRLTLGDGNARVIAALSGTRAGAFSLRCSDDGSLLADCVELERALVHCPRQLFFGLYEYCSAGCIFCPLSLRKEAVTFTVDEMLADIDRLETQGVESIGITTGVPPGMTPEQVGVELASVTRAICERTAGRIPIGVSTKHPSRRVLEMLRDAGATEARLNIEVFNPSLAAALMPRKHLDDILCSVAHACEVFGRGMVSSNIIIGIGETDEDVFAGVTALAEMGAVATLYPYDPVPALETRLRSAAGSAVGIPSADRLVWLAQEHKRILDVYGLQANALKTMCPGCAASHIMPGRDL